MRTIAMATATMLAGCDLLFDLQHIGDVPDALVDGPTIDAPCIGAGLLTGMCIDSSMDTLNLVGPINTTLDPRCTKVPQATGPELCVISALSTIVVRELVQVSGDRPLVLLAGSAIEVEQLLDASSKLGVRTGVAARTTCSSGLGGAGIAGGGGGGGAGGTFGFPGGPGGAGGMGSATPSIGGNPASVMALTAVVGGCSGGAGGIIPGGTRALGGPGGGALYLIAGAQIHVAATGAINASGSGGAGATRGNGGGGGGSGGLLALDAPMVLIDGPVFARGGGGGGGGGSTANGSAGAEPMAVGAAAGGAAGAGGSPGGDGCGTPNGMQGGFTSTAVIGGGGGGGGCGRIRLYGQRVGSGTFSPAPT